MSLDFSGSFQTLHTQQEPGSQLNRQGHWTWLAPAGAAQPCPIHLLPFGSGAMCSSPAIAFWEETINRPPLFQPQQRRAWEEGSQGHWDDGCPLTPGLRRTRVGGSGFYRRQQGSVRPPGISKEHAFAGGCGFHTPGPPSSQATHLVARRTLHGAWGWDHFQEGPREANRHPSGQHHTQAIGCRLCPSPGQAATLSQPNLMQETTKAAFDRPLNFFLGENGFTGAKTNDSSQWKGVG